LKIATAETKLAPSRANSLQSALNCARLSAENKARDVVVLDLTGVTPMYDYFVIATGTSRRQIHNLAEEIDALMKTEGHKRLGIEGYESAKWVVQDYGDIVVHIFDKETRDYYELEELWADARKLDWQV
jgi:ribosome-associated protein